MAKVSWDQSTVDDPQPRDFDVLPRGKYPCVVLDSSEKDTRAKDGKYFEFEFEVVAGDFKKRKLWARLNIENPSEVAQRIGREQFKGLCKACGKEGAKTTEALHGKYVVCLVSIEQGQNGPMNRVDGFMSPQDFKEKGGESPSLADAEANAAATARRPAAAGGKPAAGKPGAKGGGKGAAAPQGQAEFDDDIPF